MDNNYPFFGQPNPNTPLDNGSLVHSAEDEEEQKRKALSHKRTTILLVVVSLIIAAFIVWEIVDLSMGGRP